MGLSSSKLPRERGAAEIQLRSEVSRLRDATNRLKDVDLQGYNRFSDYLKEVVATAKDITQLYREARGRNLLEVPDADISTLGSLFAVNVVCERLFRYLDSDRTELMKRKPVIPALASMFNAAGLSIACLNADAKREVDLRNDIRNGKKPMVTYTKTGFRQRKTRVKKRTTKRKGKGTHRRR